MANEYEGKIDRGSDGVSKTVFVLPRPLQRACDMIRAFNLTGDPAGYRDASFDDGMTWQGLDAFAMRQIEGQQQGIAGRIKALDEAFYE